MARSKVDNPEKPAPNETSFLIKSTQRRSPLNMTRKLASLAAIAAVAVMGLFVFSESRVGGQQAPQTQVYPDVWKEIAHDTAGPMNQLGRPAPKGGPNHNVNWLKREHKPQHGPADSVVQSSSGPLLGTTGLLNFGGVGANGWAPPDTNGAVGATQYVQWVNVEYAVYNKSNGARIQGPFAGNSFWTGFADSQCASNNSGDPVAQYDKAANRWVMVQPVFTSPYRMCFAVSTTSDATGTYNRYSFSMPNFPDYPKIGVWTDAYYGSFNLFQGNSYVGAYACAFDRNAMLNGTAATAQCFTTPSEFSFLPSDLDGSTPPPVGSPDYFVDLGSLNNLDLYAFHVDFSNSANSTFTGPAFITTAGYNEACGGGTCIPQPGTNQQLDSLGDRLMYRLAYRNFGDHEALVVSHAVDNGSGVSGIRWYEIRSPGSNPTVYQQGTFSPDSAYRWMPSIAMDKSGDIAVGYSASSGSVFPSIRYTGRIPGDTLGTLETENSILTGTASQTNGLGRWGDYSAMSIDPVDDCTFYYTNQYQPSNGSFNWATQIASFKFPTCGGAPVPDFSLSATPTSQTATTNGGSAGYTITATSVNGYSGTVDFSVATCPATLTCGVLPASGAVASGGNTSTTLTVTTTGSTAAGNYNVAVTAKDSSGNPSHQTSVTLVVTDFSLASSPTSNTVTQGNPAGYGITAKSLNTFSGTVNLSVTSCPSGLTCSLASGSVSVPSGGTSSSDTLTVSTTASTPTGNYNVTVTGSDSGITHTVTVSLTVNPVGAQPDFSLSASPTSRTVRHGSSTTYTLTVTALNGFTGTVSFTVTNLPSRSNASFSPSSVTGSGSSTLTISTNRKTPTGTRTLTVTGTSGSLSHPTTVTLTVN